MHVIVILCCSFACHSICFPSYYIKDPFDQSGGLNFFHNYSVQKAVRHRVCKESKRVLNSLSSLTIFFCTQRQLKQERFFLIFISLSREYSATAFNILQNNALGNCSYHVQLHSAFWIGFKFNHNFFFSNFLLNFLAPCPPLSLNKQKTKNCDELIQGRIDTHTSISEQICFTTVQWKHLVKWLYFIFTEADTAQY